MRCTHYHHSTIKDTRSERSLDMDHVHVPFLYFLAVYYCVLPNAMYLWVSGIACLLVRDHLHRHHVVHMQPCNYEAVMFQLCVNGLAAMNFKRIVHAEDGRLVGEFVWNDICYMKMDATIGTVAQFIVIVDLQETVMISATVDGNAVTAKKATILLWFETVFGSHVKAHATANWGIARTFPTAHLKWLSACTVMYNYFGFTVFPFIMRFLHVIGCSKRDYGKIGEATRHSTTRGTPCHSNIRKLMPYSKFVSFLVRLRKFFLHSCEEYRDDFPGADPEAMFVGSVLHSLDHSLMYENIEDPLWLDDQDEEYGAMAELMRLVRAGFVQDLPGLIFSHRYKNIEHAFHRKVYLYAVKLDPWLADRMDACILK